MAANFDLKILSPSRTIASLKVVALTLPGTEGYMTILPNHVSMVAELDVGEVIVSTHDGKVEHYFLAGGYVEVENNVVNLLGSVVEKLQEIDSARAEAAKKRAFEQLSQLDSDHVRANLALKRADQRLILAKTLASMTKI